MIKFKQYADINPDNGNVTPNEIGVKLERIARFLHQANPRNIPTIAMMFINSNNSICWQMRFPSGDRVPCSDYINDEIFSKIVHYNEYEFKWSNGQPVKRESPLAGRVLSVREEMANAYTSIYNEPRSLVIWLYNRIEEVFDVSLVSFNPNQ